MLRSVAVLSLFPYSWPMRNTGRSIKVKIPLALNKTPHLLAPVLCRPHCFTSSLLEAIVLSKGRKFFFLVICRFFYKTHRADLAMLLSSPLTLNCGKKTIILKWLQYPFQCFVPEETGASRFYALWQHFIDFPALSFIFLGNGCSNYTPIHCM